jgi:hypothetical protein
VVAAARTRVEDREGSKKNLERCRNRRTEILCRILVTAIRRARNFDQDFFDRVHQGVGGIQWLSCLSIVAPDEIYLTGLAIFRR